MLPRNFITSRRQIIFFQNDVDLKGRAILTYILSVLPLQTGVPVVPDVGPSHASHRL